jgi:hypothetical protein
VTKSRYAPVVLATGLFVVLFAACSKEERRAADPAAAQLSVSAAGWETDFSNHTVGLDEFASGGPGKDGIPALDEPRFESTGEADRLLDDREPVAVVDVGRGPARAYPLRIMVWHEIVNDRIDGRPIAVTYCPLCNSTVAFDRRVDGQTLSFGTTGNLRRSDLVMYDRQTESWWQQITAEAVVGELAGAQLRVLPSQILSWRDYQRLYPDGRVLSTETGFERPYGENPYAGYDDPDSAPFALDSEPDGALPPKERVVAVQTGEMSAVVYPFTRLRDEAPVNDFISRAAKVRRRPIVVLFDPEVGSALDSESIPEGREVGAAAVFDRRLGGRTLSFDAGPDPGTFVDAQTGSTWEITGEAVAGPLAGRALAVVPSDDQFWFALAAFFPDAEIRGPA